MNQGIPSREVWAYKILDLLPKWVTKKLLLSVLGGMIFTGNVNSQDIARYQSSQCWFTKDELKETLGKTFLFVEETDAEQGGYKFFLDHPTQEGDTATLEIIPIQDHECLIDVRYEVNRAPKFLKKYWIKWDIKVAEIYDSYDKQLLGTLYEFPETQRYIAVTNLDLDQRQEDLLKMAWYYRIDNLICRKKILSKKTQRPFLRNTSL